MEKVILEKQGHEAALFINRPAAFNVFDLDTMIEMEEVKPCPGGCST